MRNSSFGFSVTPETRQKARRKNDMTCAHITGALVACPSSAFGRFVPVVTGRNRHMIAGDDRLNPQWLHNVGLSEKAPMLRFRFSDTAGNGWPDFIFNEFGFISNEFRRRSSQGDIESP
jgi:hypothetical protein